MRGNPSNGTLAAGLVFAIVLWGGNNVGVKYLVRSWPPIWIGCSRFLISGLLLLAILRWTTWLGVSSVGRTRTPGIWPVSLCLAAYIVVYNWALFFTSASNVALYLGASPVWALLAEGRPRMSWPSLQRYGAALLALAGVVVLFLPTLALQPSRWLGEVLGLGASVLWTVYSRQCRSLGASLSGTEITAVTMWRAGLLLAPMATFECLFRPPVWKLEFVLIQVYSILGAGIVAFGLWNHALRYWKTSRVFLFNNLIPLSTMSWAYLFLRESITETFWWAMLLVVAGVLLGQTNWQRVFGNRWLPQE